MNLFQRIAQPWKRRKIEDVRGWACIECTGVFTHPIEWTLHNLRAHRGKSIADRPAHMSVWKNPDNALGTTIVLSPIPDGMTFKEFDAKRAPIDLTITYRREH